MTNRIQSVFRQLGGRVLIQGLCLLGGLMLLGFLIKQIDFEQLLTNIGFSNDPGTDLLHGPVGYLLLGSFLVSVGAPRQVISFFAGFFFTLWIGFLLAMAATIGGCIITYCLAVLFRKPAKNLISGKVDLAVRYWSENTFSTTVIIRLLPAGSNLVTNLAAGVSGIRLLPFVAGSGLGYIPQTFIFALIGSGVDVGSEFQIAVSVILFIVSAIMGFWLYARYRRTIKTNPAKPTATG